MFASSWPPIPRENRSIYRRLNKKHTAPVASHITVFSQIRFPQTLRNRPSTEVKTPVKRTSIRWSVFPFFAKESVTWFFGRFFGVKTSLFADILYTMTVYKPCFVSSGSAHRREDVAWRHKKQLQRRLNDGCFILGLGTWLFCLQFTLVLTLIQTYLSRTRSNRMVSSLLMAMSFQLCMELLNLRSPKRTGKRRPLGAGRHWTRSIITMHCHA